MKNVLIVEDDVNILDIIKINLEAMDCKVSASGDGEDGYLKALDRPFDLIILDIMLPTMDGLEICRKLRGKEIQTPILMLSAKSEEIDKILGLETGADDYLTKPFSVRELQARVKALFRRTRFSESKSEQEAKASVFECGELKIDFDKRKITKGGERIDLSPKEFEILKLLAQSPGKSYSRTQLLNNVWGYDFSGYEHTVNSHINRLRAKIEPDVNNPSYILTTWGVGYRFTDKS